jgi:hypothetical protein
MDWANERYVRLFVRDTTTWKLLPWQSRALLPLILRKLDRAGVIDLGEDGEEGLAAVVEVPLEFLQEGLPALLKREVFKMAHGKFVMPNFMAAQEAKQSDAQRKRESREIQRLAAMRSQDVTACPPVSVLVTPDQSGTSPDPRLDQENSPPRDPCATGATHRPTGHDLCCLFGRLRREVLGYQGPPGSETPPDGTGKASSFAAGIAPDAVPDIEPSMRIFLRHLKDGDEGWPAAQAGNAAMSFGSWRARFGDLRAELSGTAPTPAKPARTDERRHPVSVGHFDAPKEHPTRTGRMEMP